MFLKELNHRSIYASPVELLDNLTTRLYDNWTFLIGPLLTVPLFFLPWIVRARRTRPMVVFVGAICFLNLFQMVLYPFHLGPVVPVGFAVVTAGIQLIWKHLTRNGPARGYTMALLVPLCLILISAMKQEAGELQLPLSYWEIAAEPHRDERANVEDWLMKRPGKQLVIVSYLPSHNPDQEWVYNGADIDGSKVVWARSIGPKQDAELAKYFTGREIWRLTADFYPARVLPYVPGK